MDTITAVRYRHATAEERRMGRTMIPRIVTYRLSKAEVLEALRGALTEDPQSETYIDGVTAADVAAAEAGRPVREGLLKSLFGEDGLAEVLVGLAPDAVADREDMLKSQAADPDSAVYDRIVVVRERIAPREERPLTGYGLMTKSQHETFIPSVADLRDRLLAELRGGGPVVKAEDAPLLDGGRVREVVLRHLYPGAVLEEHASTENLLKSIRGDGPGSELRRIAEELEAVVQQQNGRWSC